MVRPMTVTDTPGVGEVHVRAWQTAYRGAMPDDYLDRLRPEDRAELWRRGVETDWIGHRDVVVVDGQVEGFVAYGPEREGDEPDCGELYALNVHPARWRHGLGRQLLRHATAELARLGFPVAVLWVVASNHRARQFYEAEGWAPDGAGRADVVHGATLEEVRYRRDLTTAPPRR